MKERKQQQRWTISRSSCWRRHHHRGLLPPFQHQSTLRRKGKSRSSPTWKSTRTESHTRLAPCPARCTRSKKSRENVPGSGGSREREEIGIKFMATAKFSNNKERARLLWRLISRWVLCSDVLGGVYLNIYKYYLTPRVDPRSSSVGGVLLYWLCAFS